MVRFEVGLVKNIFRYFRFYSRISSNGNNHDEATLSAIENNCAGLANISGERIWTEMSKILIQPFSFEFIHLVYKVNMAQYIGLPKISFEGEQNFLQFSVVTHHVNIT